MSHRLLTGWAGAGFPLLGRDRLVDLVLQRAGDVPRPVRAGRVGDPLRQSGREGPAVRGERGPLGRVEPDGDVKAHRRLIAVDVEIQLTAVFEEIPPGGLAEEDTHAYGSPLHIFFMFQYQRG